MAVNGKPVFSVEIVGVEKLQNANKEVEKFGKTTAQIVKDFKSFPGVVDQPDRCRAQENEQNA